MSIKELKAYFRRYPQSHKKVVAICDGCGKVRIVFRSGYRDLCRKCGAKIAANSPEVRRKKSESHKGIPKSKAVKRKISATKKGKPKSEAEKQKYSAAKQGIPYDEWEAYACEKKYCPKFNDACRESNREKYGRECFICGKTEKANGQKLSVHHVDMDKAQGCESNWKLVPLCRSCHIAAHNDEIIARLGYLIR